MFVWFSIVLRKLFDCTTFLNPCRILDRGTNFHVILEAENNAGVRRQFFFHNPCIFEIHSTNTDDPVWYMGMLHYSRGSGFDSRLKLEGCGWPELSVRGSGTPGKIGGVRDDKEWLRPQGWETSTSLGLKGFDRGLVGDHSFHQSILSIPHC